MSEVLGIKVGDVFKLGNLDLSRGVASLIRKRIGEDICRQTKNDQV